jgi:hypothetical protein
MDATGRSGHAQRWTRMPSGARNNLMSPGGVCTAQSYQAGTPWSDPRSAIRNIHVYHAPKPMKMMAFGFASQNTLPDGTITERLRAAGALATWRRVAGEDRRRGQRALRLPTGECCACPYRATQVPQTRADLRQLNHHHCRASGAPRPTMAVASTWRSSGSGKWSEGTRD